MLKLRTQSFRRYRIVGRLPSIYSDDFAARLKDRAFQPLGAAETRTYGWVTADNLLMTQFDVDTLIRGEQACFSLRVDRRRVPARLLRAHVDLELRARRKAAEDDGGPARISRDERREIREGLERELLRNTPPSIDAFPLLIHPKRKVCCVLSLHSQAREVVPLHFQDTFDAHLVPLTPSHRGSEILDEALGGDAALRAGFDTLHRSDFGALPETAEADGTPAGRITSVVPEEVS